MAVHSAPSAGTRSRPINPPAVPRQPRSLVSRVLFASEGTLRNGWWIVVFVALFLASRALYTPLSRGLRTLVEASWLTDPLQFAMVLLVTYIAARLRRETLASVGFDLGRRWFGQLAGGTLMGVLSAVLAVAVMVAAGGARLQLDPARSMEALLQGAYLFLFVALIEETLFRGFVFQRLIAGTNAWIAQIALALLFASSHWGNAEMSGATLFWASVELFLAAILLGLAYLRTRSLALPVGIHLGWNWAQGHLLGFGVSGFEYAGWFQPVLAPGRPAWVTGGQFGLEATVFAVASDLLLILLLWRWKGSGAQATATDLRPRPR